MSETLSFVIYTRIPLENKMLDLGIAMDQVSALQVVRILYTLPDTYRKFYTITKVESDFTPGCICTITAPKNKCSFCSSFPHDYKWCRRRGVTNHKSGRRGHFSLVYQSTQSAISATISTIITLSSAFPASVGLLK